MSTTKKAFTDRNMQATAIEAGRSTPTVIRRAQKALENNLRKIGPSEAVKRFLSSYGKVRVQSVYSLHLLLYFRWLKGSGTTNLAPDELITDNLRCIYRSEAEDVAQKRKHREWLETFVNKELEGYAMSYRAGAASTVKKWYERNDSPLFGEVRIAESDGEPRDKPLSSEDIRKVLKALPLQIRTPLLLVWQSSCEVNRILGLRWKDIDEGLRRADHPLKLSFLGRKNHKKPWYTFLGRDSIEHLRLLRQRWAEEMAREPLPSDLVFAGKLQGSGVDPKWLNQQMRKIALRMHAQGMVENGEPSSWRSHMLRHSFKTEAEHCGVKSAFVEEMMGHEGGIAAVYDDRDQVHPEDLRQAYLRIEPHVSLDFNEAIARDEKDKELKPMMELIVSLQKRIASLESSQPASSGARGQKE